MFFSLIIIMFILMKYSAGQDQIASKENVHIHIFLHLPVLNKTNIIIKLFIFLLVVIV